MENKQTTLVHAGQMFELTNAVSPRIYQTSTWYYDRPEQLADVATTQQHAQTRAPVRSSAFFCRLIRPN